jgi:hypothetical protein
LPGAATPVSISARLPNEPGMADDADTERVTFTIANLRSINSKRLYASSMSKYELPAYPSGS